MTNSCRSAPRESSRRSTSFENSDDYALNRRKLTKYCSDAPLSRSTTSKSASGQRSRSGSSASSAVASLGKLLLHPMATALSVADKFLETSPNTLTVTLSREEQESLEVLYITRDLTLDLFQPLCVRVACRVVTHSLVVTPSLPIIHREEFTSSCSVSASCLC